MDICSWSTFPRAGFSQDSTSAGGKVEGAALNLGKEEQAAGQQNSKECKPLEDGFCTAAGKAQPSLRWERMLGAAEVPGVNSMLKGWEFPRISGQG